MKNRAVGMTAFVLALISLLGSLVWLKTAYDESLIPRMRQAGLAQLPPIPNSNPADLERMEYLMTRLTRLSEPVFPSRKALKLSLLGYDPPSQEEAKSFANVYESATPKRVTHAVSMAFVSASSRKAMIDNVLHNEGDTLDDGSLIAQINAGMVVLRNPEGQEEILTILFPEEVVDANNNKSNKILGSGKDLNKIKNDKKISDSGDGKNSKNAKSNANEQDQLNSMINKTEQAAKTVNQLRNLVAP